METLVRSSSEAFIAHALASLAELTAPEGAADRALLTDAERVRLTESTATLVGRLQGLLLVLAAEADASGAPRRPSAWAH